MSDPIKHRLDGIIMRTSVQTTEDTEGTEKCRGRATYRFHPAGKRSSGSDAVSSPCSTCPPWLTAFSRIILHVLPTLFLLGALAPASAADLPERRADSARKQDAQALVVASDAVRNPDGTFAVDVLLNEYRSGKLNATSSLVVYSRPSVSSGQYRNLVRFAGPARDAGKLMLRNGMDLWFYDPANRASVRISPQQRLLGQASNGDVMTTNLARDFDAEWMGEERVQDGEKRERRTVVLRLVARRDDVAYPLVEYWVDAASKQPVKATYYTAEGRLLKSAWFRRFEETLGAVRPTETVIVDGLNSQWVTIMRNANYRYRDVPEAWLQRDYLARFTGD